MLSVGVSGIRATVSVRALSLVRLTRIVLPYRTSVCAVNGLCCKWTEDPFLPSRITTVDGKWRRVMYLVR